MQAMSSGTDWTDTTFNEDQWDNYDRIVKQLETGLGKERFEAFNPAGNPPAMLGDSRSLTAPGVLESFDS